MLLRAISSLTLANVVLAAAMFGLISATGHLQGAETVGHLTYLNSLVAPAMVLAQLALRQNYVSAAVVPIFAQVRRVRFLASLAMFTVLMVGGFFVTENQWLWLALIGLAAWRFAENMSDLYYAYGQRQSQFGAMSKSIMLRATLGVSGFIGTLWLTEKLWLAALVFGLAGWGIVLAYDAPTHAKRYNTSEKNLEAPEDKALLKGLLIASVPLTFALFTSSLAFSIPRFLMNHYDTAFNLGIFGAMMHLMMMAGIVVNAIGQALLPVQSRHWQAREFGAFAKKVALGVALVWACFGVGFILILGIGDMAMALLFGDEFTGYTHEFLLVALGGLAYFTGQMLIYATTAARIFKGMLFAAVASAVAVLVVGILLIPSQGMVGAAWSTVALGGAASAASLALLLIHGKKQAYAA